MVSYCNKHNEQNGEGNRDGSDNNNSYNYGYEGVCLNKKIEAKRMLQIRNFLLTLLISQGTPMLLGGDEMRRTQGGNNNAYCQDNEISWFDWNLEKENASLIEFTRRAIALRKNHEVFRRTEFFKGCSNNGIADICWYTREGTIPDWNKVSHFLAFRLSGESVESKDNDFYVMANTDIHDVVAILPLPPKGTQWYRVADTSIEEDDAIREEGNEEVLPSQKRYVVPSSSLIVLIAK